MRPMPSKVRRRNKNSAIGAGLEGGQGGDERIVFIGQADGDAQALRQAVAADAPDDDVAARAGTCPRLRRGWRCRNRPARNFPRWA